MNHVATRFILAGLVTFFVTTSSANITCRSMCQCLTYSVRCIGKGLKIIPEGIPSTVTSINLSHNPQLEIPSEYFLQFEHLTVLFIINCGQRGPVYLPKSVKEVRLGENFFTVDALRQMFSNNQTSLKRVSLGRNRLKTPDTKKVLKILPPGLEKVNINYNKLSTLTREDMMQFKDIHTLQIEHSSLESIDAGAFDHMRNLTILKLNSNNLCSFPDSLFKFNLKLLALQIKDNILTDFNATKLNLRDLQDIRLGKNSIKTFDIRDLRANVVMLNDNQIQELEENIFNYNQGVFTLMLNNNNIRDISRRAFKGIKFIGKLLLNNNKLTSLPKKMFEGMAITNLFLQNNQLSNLNGIFHGMKKFPSTLMLTENKRLTLLNGSEFQSLQHDSKIYLNCNNLRRIINLYKVKAKFKCFPNVNDAICTNFYEWFSCHGYECKRIKLLANYKCIVCRSGYYSSCRDVEKHQSTCIQCPAGSYYQDEAASTECKICRPGQFVPPERSPGTSASDCQTCPQGSNTTSVAGTRACKCLHGYSRKYRFGSCQKCLEKGYNCNKDYKTLNSGFWMTWQGTQPDYASRNTVIYNYNGTTNICEQMYRAYIRNLDITDDTYDRRTMYFNCQMPLPIKCPVRSSCLGGIQPRCSTGYKGVICAVCGKGYTRQFSQCVKCPKRVWAAIEFIAYIVLFGLVCFIISSTYKYSVEYHTSSLRRHQEAEERTFADILLSSLKILIGFYQVLISIIHALSHVHWPENLKTAINILQYMQFQVIHLPSLRCTNSEWNINAIDEFWIIVIIEAIVPLIAVTYYFIKSLYVRYQCVAPAEAKRKRCICGENCAKCVGLFLFVTYTLITTKIVEILPISCHSFCTAMQNGSCVYSMSFLRSDYSISCPTLGINRATLLVGYSCIILPLGLPVLLLLLLKWYVPRPRIQKQMNTDYVNQECNHHEYEDWNKYDLHFSSMNDTLLGDSTAPIMASALKFTYENYHSRFWYWEVIEMTRKLLMAIGILIFAGHTEIGLACTMIVAIFFTILHAIHKPFKSTFENRAQFLSLILIPLNLAFVVVGQLQDKESPSTISKKGDSFSLGPFIVVMNSCLIFVVFGRIILIIALKVKLLTQKVQ